MRRNATRLEHLLGIEMTPVPIGRRNNVTDREFRLAPHFGKIMQGGMQTEESIEVDRCAGACLQKCKRTAHRLVIGIAMRRNGSETIQTTPQDHHDKAA